MRIIGPPSASLATVNLVLSTQTAVVHARFRNEMVPALWDTAVEYGIDPVGMIAQSWKETAGGNFTGAVKPGFFNTGGIKVREMGLFPGIDDGDNPLAHQRFANWYNGAEAHAQHIRAYAGWPVLNRIVSPRYHFVVGKHKLENFENFGGKDAAGNIKWAPSSTYGIELVDIARKLQG